MAKKKGMAWQELAFWLVVIGALNWGLLGLVGFNAVSWLVGMVPGATRLVYLLVGLSGVYCCMREDRSEISGLLEGFL